MAKRTIAPIVGRRIRLRLLEAHDLPTTLAWRNQDHIRKWFFHSDLIDPHQHQAWFARYQERDDDFVFIIEDVGGTRRPIGQVALYNLDWVARRGEFGRLMIGERSAEGKGLAKEVTLLLVDEALTRWGLAEVFLEVKDENQRAITLYQSCGFSIRSRAGGVVTCVRQSPLAAGAPTAGRPRGM